MRRYGVLLLALVLATASLLAAAAYNTATVANAATFEVVNTNAALLAIEDTDTSGDNTVQVVNGQMQLKFGIGRGDLMFGFQPASRYAYNDIIKIRNNSTDLVYVWYTLDGDLLTAYLNGELRLGVAPNVLWKERNNAIPHPGTFTVYEVMTITGGTASFGHWTGPVSFFFDIPQGKTLGTYSGNLYIHSSTANPYGALPWHP